MLSRSKNTKLKPRGAIQKRSKKCTMNHWTTSLTSFANAKQKCQCEAPKVFEKPSSSARLQHVFLETALPGSIAASTGKNSREGTIIPKWEPTKTYSKEQNACMYFASLEKLYVYPHWAYHTLCWPIMFHFGWRPVAPGDLQPEHFPQLGCRRTKVLFCKASSGSLEGFVVGSLRLPKEMDKGLSSYGLCGPNAWTNCSPSCPVCLSATFAFDCADMFHDGSNRKG